MTCPTNDPRHEECPICADGSCRMVEVHHYTKVPRIDPDTGEQMREPITGTLMHIAVPYQQHVVSHSAFNASGLVVPNPLCRHGIPCPPDVDPGLPSMITSRMKDEMLVVRSKYLNGDGLCPVCRGEPRPADLCTPRA